MKINVQFHDFYEAFRSCGRQYQFSYDGFRILFDYIEELEKDLDEEYELDVIAICCDFAEATGQEIVNYYNIEVPADADEDDIETAVIDYLCDVGCYVGKTSHGFVYRQH